MPTGQGKPDHLTRYLEFQMADHYSRAVLTIVDGSNRESVHSPHVFELAVFAEQLARTAELVLISDFPGH
jgi:hypothetical protein